MSGSSNVALARFMDSLLKSGATRTEGVKYTKIESDKFTVLMGSDKRRASSAVLDKRTTPNTLYNSLQAAAESIR